jgi:hypothetical protein
MDESKHKAIKDYLQTEKKCTVTEYADGTKGIWQFQVLQTKGPSPIVALTDEFIDDRSATEIAAKLNEWKVIEQALAAPDKLLTVASAGVKIGPRQP